LRVNLKKIYDAILTKNVLEMKIFWKNADGSSVNFVQHIIEIANLYATDMKAEICDIACLLLVPVIILSKEQGRQFSFDINEMLGVEFKTYFDNIFSEANDYLIRMKSNKGYNTPKAYNSLIKYIDSLIAGK